MIEIEERQIQTEIEARGRLWFNLIGFSPLYVFKDKREADTLAIIDRNGGFFDKQR